MVTTSFTLRKTSVGYGSYVQKDADDTALRSDNYISPSNAVALTNTFSANIIDHESVLLSWKLSELLVTTSATAAPVALTIVASSTGEPQTIKDGDIVFTTTSNSVSSYVDIPRVEKGRWVYYTLFAKYSDFDQYEWYESLASLYIQIPKQYNSIDNLWARIPDYYKNLDAAQEGQPLYNFLELFGWEMDRTRTLIDTIALSNDPELAVTPALAELAYEMGLETTIEAVGPTKVRKLLQSIGKVRRNKGTLQSIEYYLSALTGCRISYERDTSNPTNIMHVFNVHSQRVNFVSDPKFSQAPTGSSTNTGANYMVASTVSPTWGVYSYGPTTSIGASASTNGTALTVTNLSTSDTINVYIYQRNEFPYYRPANLYTTFTPTLSTGASFVNFHIAETEAVSFWESGYPPLSMPTDFFLDTWNTTKKELLSDSRYPAQKRYEITSNSASVNPINVFPVLHFSLNAGASVVVKDWLVEHFAPGEYFDGNTKEGGYIPSITGNGVGTYDYRWEGTTNSSFSYYMLDYKRISEITPDIIKNYIAPVTVSNNITINWNYYYGKN